VSQPAPESNTLAWRHELDLLRLIAVTGVLVYHCVPDQPGYFLRLGLPQAWAGWAANAIQAGKYGVDVFFCLSAYLITDLLMRERRVRGSVDYGAFIVRRTLRIWPLYFFYLAVLAVALPWLLPGASTGTMPWRGFLTFTLNWDIVRHGFPGSPGDHLWSVSIEEQFYLAWPLLLAAIGWHRRAMLLLGASLLAVACLARAYLIAGGAVHPAIWCNTLARLDPIALGAMAAVMLQARVPVLATWARLGLVAMSLFGLVYAARMGADAGPAAHLSYPLVALSSLGLLFAFLGMPKADAPWLGLPRFLGRISYGIYVYSYLATVVAMRLVQPRSVSAGLLLSFFATAGVATVSWYAIELPFLKLKARFARGAPSLAAPAP